MTTQKAVVVTGPKQAQVVADRPIPALRDDYILVKTVSVAINPTDWKHIDYLAPPGVLVGCDYAGIVQEVGKDVQKSFQKGDRVCGFVHGSNAVQPEGGAFAEYIVAKGDLQMKIPDHLSFQEAATLGLGVTTAGQGLYQGLKLALLTEPIQEALPVLIYGGSTATGTLAIQFAKLSGYSVLTTCSPRNFDQVKRLGADAVFDYHDPDSANAIKALTNDNLKLVFDTISTEDSARYCDRAISSQGGDYSALLPLAIERPTNVNHGATMAYTAFGEGFKFGPRDIPPKPEDYTFAKCLSRMVEKLLAEGKLRVHPPKVCPAGLNGTLEGLVSMREGKVSGEKFVYNVADTP
ncbi:zinc-binding oxidoreductase [Aspergillus bertholletiae]|uniref:Zinc-binding oxidoreductase n=1 Tax=Aspergillus bertholletiae TaxID=1226010 RepID=A0A5N7B710_9EURO|nr:zinc-binding oxidoreductase [Aspergillus bertholletiae]